MKENLQIFDWELSDDDYDKIGQIKQHRMMLKEELVSAHGPYKSIEELWDGELYRTRSHCRHVFNVYFNKSEMGVGLVH